MRLLPTAPLFALTLTALAGRALAQNPTVDLSPAKDNTMYTADPVSGSNGAGTRLFSGYDIGGTNRRALLAFQIAGAVPAGSTILSATLELGVAQTRAAALPVNLHRVSADWGEQGSIASSGQGGGGQAQTGDATWDFAFWPTTPWQTAGGGGDFVAAPSATTVVGSTGRFQWTSPQLIADAQAMLDTPGGNFGWILITDETGSVTSARAFHSREAGAADRPKLTLTYLPPAATATSFGTGCNGGGPTPLTLSANGLPSVGNANFGFALAGGPTGNTLGIVDLFFQPQVPPLPLGGGCSLYGNIGTLLTGLAATPTVPFGIPNNTALYGFELVFQAIVFDTSTFSLAASNGVSIRVGA
ncbi:MAG: DNRLRE domain-containing protein [Planctomycetota bacterium]